MCGESPDSPRVVKLGNRKNAGSLYAARHGRKTQITSLLVPSGCRIRRAESAPSCHGKQAVPAKWLEVEFSSETPSLEALAESSEVVSGLVVKADVEQPQPPLQPRRQ